MVLGGLGGVVGGLCPTLKYSSKPAAATIAQTIRLRQNACRIVSGEKAASFSLANKPAMALHYSHCEEADSPGATFMTRDRCLRAVVHTVRVGVELCANVTACHRYLLECSLQHCKLHQSRNKTGLAQTGRGSSIGLSRRHSGAVTNRPRPEDLGKASRRGPLSPSQRSQTARVMAWAAVHSAKRTPPARLYPLAAGGVHITALAGRHKQARRPRDSIVEQHSASNCRSLGTDSAETKTPPEGGTLPITTCQAGPCAPRCAYR